jgi:hypothetical protein
VSDGGVLKAFSGFSCFQQTSFRFPHFPKVFAIRMILIVRRLRGIGQALVWPDEVA